MKKSKPSNSTSRPKTKRNVSPWSVYNDGQSGVTYHVAANDFNSEVVKNSNRFKEIHIGAKSGRTFEVPATRSSSRSKKTAKLFYQLLTSY